MLKYQEIYLDEKLDKNNGNSMKELSKYSNILEKGGNLYFVVKNQEVINVENCRSLKKISKLLGKLPEELVNFTLYDEEIEEYESEDKSNYKRSSKKLLITVNANKAPEKDDASIDINSSSVNLTDNIKEPLAKEVYKKENNIIGSNFVLYKKIWTNLYKLSSAISSINLLALSFYEYKSFKDQKYSALGAASLSFSSLSLMIYTSFSGNQKLLSKKKVNFKKENILLSTFIIMSLGSLALFLFQDNKADINSYILTIIKLISGLLIVISISLIYLNIKIVEFYRKYNKIAEEGILLTEIK